MASQSIVVIGGSAGGIEALIRLVALLPADLPAALCIVIHQPTDGRSMLPEILSRSGPLPATHARNGELLRPRHIYVAPPNRQLVVDGARLRLMLTPRENGHRPAIDPLFRSAARSYGPDVVGVLLSGADDDGTEGLLIVKARGGKAFVQDPREALFARMPASAAEHVDVDAVLRIPELAQAIVREVVARMERSEGVATVQQESDPERGSEQMDQRVEDWKDGEPEDTASGFACPLCGGGIWIGKEGPLTRFRCHTGHRFSSESFLQQQAMVLESTLWQAMRALSEREALLRRLARQDITSGATGLGSRFKEQADELAQGITLMRQVLQGNGLQHPGDDTAV